MVTTWGIVLAGGQGTRFAQGRKIVGGKLLATVGDEPLIVHSVRRLLQLGATRVIVAASSAMRPVFQALFRQFMVETVEVVTTDGNGVPATLEVALRSITDDLQGLPVMVTLGDNVFTAEAILSEVVTTSVEAIRAGFTQGLLVVTESDQPQRHAVLTLDVAGNLSAIEEKPEQPASNLIATGMYVFPANAALAACREIGLSARGERETGTFLQALLQRGVRFHLHRITPEQRVNVDTPPEAGRANELVRAQTFVPTTSRGRPCLFITGIAGFLGSRMARDAVAAGYPVLGVDDLSTGYAENLPEGCELNRDWFLIDLTRRSNIPKLTRFMMEAKRRGDGRVIVVHTACPAYDALSHVLMSYVMKGVVVGTTVTLAAAIRARVTRFVNLSSMARYEIGSMDLHRLRVGYREDDVVGGMSPYGQAKVAAERLVRDACDKEGIPWTTLVFHNVIGSGQQYNNPARNVASMLLNMGLHGRDLYIHGDGSQRRVFTPWEDVAGPIHELITNLSGLFDGLTLNVGPGAQYDMSVRELCEVIARVSAQRTGRPYQPEIRSMSTHTLASLRTAACNSQRYQAFFGRSPSPDIERTLWDMAKHISVQPREFDYRIFRAVDLGKEKLDPVYRNKLFRIAA